MQVLSVGRRLMMAEVVGRSASPLVSLLRGGASLEALGAPQRRNANKFRPKHFLGTNPLHRKRAPIGYYRGMGIGAEGKHTSKGGYIFDPELYAREQYVFPDLRDFTLKPYVTKAAKSIRVQPPTLIQALNAFRASVPDQNLPPIVVDRRPTPLQQKKLQRKAVLKATRRRALAAASVAASPPPKKEKRKRREKPTNVIESRNVTVKSAARPVAAGNQ